MLGTNNNLSLSATLPTAITSSPYAFNLQGGDLTKSVRRETATGDVDKAATITVQSRFVDGKNAGSPASKRQQINIRVVKPQENTSSGTTDECVVSLTISRLNILNANATDVEALLGHLFNMVCDPTVRASLLRGET